MRIEIKTDNDAFCDVLIEIQTDNAAFCDGNLQTEVSRILRNTIKRIQDGKKDGRLRDVNGNTVGGFEVQ